MATQQLGPFQLTESNLRLAVTLTSKTSHMAFQRDGKAYLCFDLPGDDLVSISLGGRIPFRRFPVGDPVHTKLADVKLYSKDNGYIIIVDANTPYKIDACGASTEGGYVTFDK